MHSNLALSLDRADELNKEMTAEYDRSLHDKKVSDRAVHLTHEICELLRSVLDRVARRYWEIHISPNISEADRAAATIYFPIATDQNGFDSTLGRWRWKTLRPAHQPIYDYLLARQPFGSASNQWLAILNDLAVKGKHIDLVPQKRQEAQTITVSAPGGSVSWGPGVTFGCGVSVMGPRSIRAHNELSQRKALLKR